MEKLITSNLLKDSQDALKEVDEIIFYELQIFRETLYKKIYQHLMRNSHNEAYKLIASCVEKGCFEMIKQIKIL